MAIATHNSFEDPFQALERRKFARDEERLRLNKRLLELNAEAEKDAVAREVLAQMYPSGFPQSIPTDREPPRADAVETPAPPPASAAGLQKRGGGMTVKDVAVAILRDAHPQGLTAKQIKGKAMLRYKKDINQNTLTVSLVRAKPQVRCEGRTWFFESSAGEAASGTSAGGLL